MLNPTPFFAADFFGTRDVTLKRLQKFSREVLIRLAADNPEGVFDPLLADLTKRYEALFGAVQRTDQGQIIRRSHAEQMWGALEDFQDQLEEDEALIDYKNKKHPGLRTAFFPNGRREYTTATLLTADLLFARVVEAAETHAAILGPEFDAARYAQFYKDFQAARANTGSGDEQAAKGRAQASTEREDLTQRLTDAVKQVAAQFPRDAARCAAYFRFELLQAARGAAEPEEKAEKATTGT